MDLKMYLKRRGAGKELAVAIGISPVVISQWKTCARPIPSEHCIEIERATEGAVRCEELRPDIDWGYLRASATDKPIGKVA